MNRSIVTTAVALLAVLAAACADSTAAEPIDTSQIEVPSAPTPEPPATDAPRPVVPDPPKPAVTDPPKPTVAPTPPKPTVAPTPATVPPTKPTVPPTPTPVPPPKPPVPPPAPTLPPQQPNGAACLVGDWTISDAELDVYFDIVAQNAGFQSIDNDGEIRLSFTETSFEWTNDYTLTMTVGDVTYESRSTGSFYGAYSEAGGVIKGMVIRDNRTGTITQDGQPVGDVGDLFAGIQPARPMDSMMFSCTGPILMLQSGPVANAHHTVRLTPA